MAGSMERSLAILELLARNGGQLPLHVIADTLNMPRSGAHRLLAMLIEQGYVRQHAEKGEYQLSLKLVSLGLIYLSTSGVADVSQPILENLARSSGELARLGIIENELITFVAKAQGARSGLRYDPDMGSNPPLFCTASGPAWLSRLDDEQALQIVARQGFGNGHDYGPNAPRTIAAFLEVLHATRKRGHAVAVDSYEPGMTSLAAPIINPLKQQVVGVVTLAGPTSRIPAERLPELGSLLQDAARELGEASLGSLYFKS